MTPDKQTHNNNKTTATKNTEQRIGKLGAKNLGTKKLGKKKFGLHRDDVTPQFRIPFIISGYRESNLRAIDCMHSAFVPTCNETINFWSHFIAFGMFLVKFHDLYATKYSVYDPKTWALLSAAIGVCGFCLASSIAHLFNSMSVTALKFCFFVDYAAISLYTVGMGLACFMYNRPLESRMFVFKTEWIFITLSLVTSINATTLCCLTTFRWQQHKYVIRTAAFVLAYIVNSAPLAPRLAFGSSDVDGISATVLWTFSIHFILFFSSAVVNALRFPERMLPGAFDIFGHSHHLMHMFTAIGACYQFDAFHLDMIERKAHLMKQPINVSFYNTLLPFAVSAAGNFGIALWFGKKAGQEIQKKKE